MVLIGRLKMKPKTFYKILDEIQYSIFRKLDKYGNYRRVDEGAARDAVSQTIKSAKSYFGDVKVGEDVKTS